MTWADGAADLASRDRGPASAQDARAALLRTAEGYAKTAQAAEEAGDLRVAAQSWNAAGLRWLRAGDARAALEGWSRWVAVERRRGDTLDLTLALRRVAYLHDQNGREDLAIAVLDEALGLLRSHEDTPAVASTLLARGLARLQFGDASGARVDLARCATLSREQGRPDREAGARSGLGAAALAAGEPVEAQAHFLASLRLRRTLGDAQGIAAALANLGLVHLERGELDLAERRLEEARAAQARAGDRAGQARSLLALARVSSRRGEAAEALTRLTCARGLLTSEGPSEDRGAIEASLGDMHLQRGELAPALEAHVSCLETWQAIGNAREVLRARLQVGLLHGLTGDAERARACFDAVLSASHDEVEPSLRRHAWRHLGALALKAGDAQAALEAFDHALAVPAAAFDAHLDVVVRTGRGNALLGLGRTDEALACQEDALARARARGFAAVAAAVLGNVADVHHALGHYQVAASLYDEAAVAAAELGVPRTIALNRWGRAQSLAARGDLRAATLECRQVVAFLPRLCGGLDDFAAPQVRGDWAGLFELAVDCAARLGDADEVHWFLECSRAAALAESLAGRGASAAYRAPEDLVRTHARCLLIERQALAALERERRRRRLDSTRRALRVYEDARRGVEDVVARIQRREKELAGVQAIRPVPAARVRQHLGPDEAFVSYVLLTNDAYAVVHTPAATRLVSLGPSAPLRADIDALTDVDRSTAFERPAAALRARLVETLALEPGVRRLVVSPHGRMAVFPFALLDPGRPLTYAFSATTHMVLAEERGEPGRSVLAFGGVDYEGRRAPLPASRAEALAVGQEVRLGANASESMLRGLLDDRPRWHAVHLACHGVQDEDRPLRSSLLLGADDENDGELTACEILQMHVPADLVALSACETGKGKVVGGEGIVGLPRALVFSGARRVLASLWRVDDEATRALMTHFYALWHPASGEGALSAAEALHQAQAAVRAVAAWQHPYYWAGWVLWGRSD